ncbi:alpha/beta fold hydrolase [Conexibacter sp. SYSU D00693]|uniref:alpha/beta fold hydrolase n=1 Tax=Conexibacter sp. SYSU D00693 TaxID=2812560 RepID=UPI00196A2B5D|nr:alpha/beta hydrolase [Conexibacter sp. SYSU D00693]
MRPLPHLDGVEHRHVDAPGFAMHVALAGPEDGDVVVLLHGWPQSWWIWRHAIPRLAAAGHRVVAPDLRGHGWSEAPRHGYDKEQLATDVLATLDALGVERFAVAGHDWGGFVAQLLGLRVPERVTRIATVNIVPVWRDQPLSITQAWRYLYIPLNASPVLGGLIPRTPLFERFQLRVASDDAAINAAGLKAHPHVTQQVYRSAILRDLRAMGARRDQRLRAPLLVLHGDRDPVITPADVERFRAHADDVEVRFLRGAGHFVVDERPDEVAEALVSHFAA